MQKFSWAVGYNRYFHSNLVPLLLTLNSCVFLFQEFSVKISNIPTIKKFLEPGSKKKPPPDDIYVRTVYNIFMPWDVTSICECELPPRNCCLHSSLFPDAEPLRSQLCHGAMYNCSSVGSFTSRSLLETLTFPPPQWIIVTWPFSENLVEEADV